MLASIRSRRAVVPALVALAAVLALIGLAPHLGLVSGAPAAAPAKVWTEQAPGAPAAVATGPWVELARQLKPAVVNISTRRVQEGAQPKSPFGDDERMSQFFRRFFDDQ